MDTSPLTPLQPAALLTPVFELAGEGSSRERGLRPYCILKRINNHKKGVIE
jgi:hypothetical protein